MRIKKENVARLASLSALGAGALGIATGTAEAEVVNITFPCPIELSPGGGSAYFHLGNANTSVTVAAGGGFDGSGQGKFTYFWNAGAEGYSNNLHFKMQAPSPATDSLGIVLDMLAAPSFAGPWSHTGTNGVIASGLVRQSVTKFYTTQYGSKLPIFQTGKTVTGSATRTFTDEYAMFTFQDVNNVTQYGWVELSVAANAPFVEVDGYGYTETTPEPSTASLGAFGALALGALGYRRWRAARKPA
ncbi:MAG TPA: hypothetical protein VMU19_08185 [Bryobacteraceae bacterium]|nr:hypothetical protein [Bryobacteraceae bacterium]